jgi:anti-sigma B factor antagonist
MAAFEARQEPQGLVITLGNPSALNDFRTNALRDALFEVVRPIDHPHVAVNLGAIDYLASSGVAILIGLKRRIDAQQGKLILFGVHPFVFDLLRSMKLTQYFTFTETEGEALAALRPVPTA